jgi:hypothetical protein
LAFTVLFLYIPCGPYYSHKNREIKQLSPAEPHAGGSHTYDRAMMPVSRRNRLRHYHILNAMQPSARCLTPWLRWTRALLAVLRSCPSATRTPRLGFGGVKSLQMKSFNLCFGCSHLLSLTSDLTRFLSWIFSSVQAKAGILPLNKPQLYALQIHPTPNSWLDNA